MGSVRSDEKVFRSIAELRRRDNPGEALAGERQIAPGLALIE